MTTDKSAATALLDQLTKNLKENEGLRDELTRSIKGSLDLNRRNFADITPHLSRPDTHPITP